MTTSIFRQNAFGLNATLGAPPTPLQVADGDQQLAQLLLDMASPFVFPPSIAYTPPLQFPPAQETHTTTNPNLPRTFSDIPSDPPTWIDDFPTTQSTSQIEPIKQRKQKRKREDVETEEKQVTKKRLLKTPSHKYTPRQSSLLNPNRNPLRSPYNFEPRPYKGKKEEKLARIAFSNIRNPRPRISKLTSGPDSRAVSPAQRSVVHDPAIHLEIRRRQLARMVNKFFVV